MEKHCGIVRTEEELEAGLKELDRLKADVGTSGGFDTPHLTGVGMSPPYLHDGRALSLEEIWTVHSPEDTHGITNDLDKVQLNDLILYLRTL